MRSHVSKGLLQYGRRCGFGKAAERSTATVTDPFCSLGRLSGCQLKGDIASFEFFDRDRIASDFEILDDIIDQGAPLKARKVVLEPRAPDFEYNDGSIGVIDKLENRRLKFMNESDRSMCIDQDQGLTGKNKDSVPSHPCGWLDSRTWESDLKIHDGIRKIGAESPRDKAMRPFYGKHEIRNVPFVQDLFSGNYLFHRAPP